MFLTVTFIGVFVALYGGVNSSPYRTYDVTYNSTNSTNTPSKIPSLYPPNGPNYTDAELTSHAFRDLVLAGLLDELRNASAQPHLNGNSRRKRAFYNLLSMLGCATDCNRLYMTWYGNYCGWGGSGRPIDDIDRCCQLHDACYARVMNDYNLWSFSMYFRSYGWECNGDRPPTCHWYQDQWRRQACLCDLRLTECLNEYGCPQW